MKSRYTAYAIGAIDYLLNSQHVSKRNQQNRSEIEQWANNNQWNRLQIVSSTLGGANQDRGEVEFKAYYTDSNGIQHIHHENSTFIKEVDQWYYLKGDINPKPDQSYGKTGRNDPCPCGSGMKYKKCCG